MHTHIDLHCAKGTFVEVILDESLRTTEARERIEQALLDRREGRIIPTTTGFCYYPPDERWDEQRIVNRLHQLLMDLFGDQHTISYYLHGEHITCEPDGTERITDPLPH